MKRIKQLSLISAVGGSLLVVDNVLNLASNNAKAQTDGGGNEIETPRIAGALTAAIELLLFDDAELALDDVFTAQQNTRLSISANIGILSNDTAQSGGTIALLQDVQNGDLTLNQDGSFEYLPNVDFIGNDSFVYQLTASNGRRNQANVNIRVNGTPVAVDDAFLISANSTFSDNVVVNIVGGNDTIGDEALVDEVIQQATALGGLISIQSNGDFQYTPPPELGSQQDSFVYTLRDTDGETDTATITWRIGISFIGLEQTLSVVENSILNGDFSVFTPGSLEYIELNDARFTLAELNAISEAIILSIPGELFGEFGITGFNQVSGELSYQYDPQGSSQDHSTALNNALREVINIRVKDTSLTEPVDAQLNIDVLDSNPTANNDSSSLDEGISAVAGNLVGTLNNAPGDVSDTLIDQNATPIISVTSTLTGDTASLSSVSNADATGSFGTLSLINTGIYTYTLDNTNAAVQGLSTGETLTDVFGYTIIDGDGDTDSAAFTVTINGVDDALPTITIPDTNDVDPGDNSIQEASTTELTGQVTLSASAQLAASGTVLSINSNTERLLTLAELNGLGATPVSVNSANGTFTLTQFNSNNGQLNYRYLVDANGQDHSDGDFSVIDAVDLQISDNEGDQSTISRLDILITDTNPVANEDTPRITENDTALTGNVVSLAGAAIGDVADTLVDSNANPISAIEFGGTDGTVGASLSGSYGALVMNTSGVYTYTLDNDNSDVQILQTNDTLTETFTYVITDSDDDNDSANLVITIDGFDDPVPVISITDTNAGAAGQSSVEQNQSANLNNVILTASAGLATSGTILSIVNGTNTTPLSPTQLVDLPTNNIDITGTNGALTLTDFDASTGVLSYTFTAESNIDHSFNSRFYSNRQ